jgi:lipopolysaccharide export system protein LptA
LKGKIKIRHGTEAVLKMGAAIPILKLQSFRTMPGSPLKRSPNELPEAILNGLRELRIQRFSVIWTNAALTTAFLLLCSINAIAQTSPPIPFDPLKFLPKSSVAEPDQGERKRIEIRNSDVLEQETDTIFGEVKRKLKGNVRLMHDGALMTCDSAILYPDGNYLEAFSRVRISKDDSVEIKSKELKYYGDTKFAILEKNVVLKDKASTLEAPRMEYDVNTDIGTFSQGGKMTTDSTVITSSFGTYYQKEKVAVFQQNVVLTHPDYTMYADSMRYDTRKKVAYFISPTIIISEKDTIFTSSGYFDTKTNRANFGQRPLIKKGEHNTLQSDQLDYDKAKGQGTAEGKVISRDTKEKVTLLANQMYYVDSINYIRATQDPLMIQEEEKDTLYLSADTLISYTEYVTDTLSGERDSIKIFYGYRDVKTLRTDMSGICDSIYFSGQDSIFRLFYEPKLWMDSTQLSADTILMYLRDKKVYLVELIQNALVINENEPGVYNQMRGRKITAYLDSNKLRQVFIDGNAESIYFMQDDSSAYVGANRSESATILVDFNSDNKVDRIHLDRKPEAIFSPIQEIDWNSFKLDGFSWDWQENPNDKWRVIRDTTQYENWLLEHPPSTDEEDSPEYPPSGEQENAPEVLPELDAIIERKTGPENDAPVIPELLQESTPISKPKKGSRSFDPR